MRVACGSGGVHDLSFHVPLHRGIYQGVRVRTFDTVRGTFDVAGIQSQNLYRAVTARVTKRQAIEK